MNNLANDLRFVEFGHKYFIKPEEDKEFEFEIPCVSNIITLISKLTYQGINDSTLMNKAVKGSKVHKAIERLNKTNGLVSILNSDDPATISFFESYKKFYTDFDFKNKYKVIANELKLYHKEKLVAGTIDCLAQDLNTGEIILIDYKCTVNLNQHLVSLQLRWYVEILKGYGYNIKNVRVLKLELDNKYKFIDLTELVFKNHTWEVCQWLEGLYKYALKNKLIKEEKD